MNLISSLDTGLVTGLIMSFSVYGLAIAFKLMNFPDLTVEGSFLLGAAGFAILKSAGFGTTTAVGFAILLGALAGLLTAVLYSVFHVNKFLSGILVVSTCYTLALRLMGSSNIGLLGQQTFFDKLDSSFTVHGLSVGKILVIASIFLLVSGIILFALSSPMGLKIRVAGCNPAYAKILNINVSKSIVAALAITNSLAAISGAMLSAHQGFADVGLGQGVLIISLASMYLGERIISEINLPMSVFVLTTSLVGSVIYQLLLAIAIRLGLNPIDLKLVTAILVLSLMVLRSEKSDGAYTEY